MAQSKNGAQRRKRFSLLPVRIICDREEEIENFVPEEYWTITANLYDSGKANEFEAKFFGRDGKKTEKSKIKSRAMR